MHLFSEIILGLRLLFYIPLSYVLFRLKCVVFFLDRLHSLLHRSQAADLAIDIDQLAPQHRVDKAGNRVAHS